MKKEKVTLRKTESFECPNCLVENIEQCEKCAKDFEDNEEIYCAGYLWHYCKKCTRREK